MPIYTEIIQNISNGGIIKSGVYKDVFFEIEKFPNNETRVAFPNGAGVIDNWCGVVWDPTGLVGTINEKSKGFFGGDLIKVRHIKEFWYVACFT